MKELTVSLDDVEGRVIGDSTCEARTLVVELRPNETEIEEAVRLRVQLKVEDRKGFLPLLRKLLLLRGEHARHIRGESGLPLPSLSDGDSDYVPEVGAELTYHLGQ